MTLKTVLPLRLTGEMPRGADPGVVLDHFLERVTATGLLPYAHQEQALLELTSGRHVVLATPTGSGKSLVALGLHWKALCEGQRSFYTAPIKALVSEKFFQLCEAFGAEQVGMLTGDASINADARIVCCTQEVLANMALRHGKTCDAPYVVMDEFHYYDDPERGHAWQTPLLALPETTFLLMSATLGNTAPIEEALGETSGREVAHIWSIERPVPLDFDYRETPLHETVEALLEEKRAPIYLVSFTQRAAAETASALTSARVTSREQRLAIRRALRGFRFDSPYGRELARILSHGVGVHHAGLLPRYRLLIEQLSQQGLLRVISGTDTLGVGVNIPIRSVLFTGLAKFDGQRQRLLSVREFQQIAGRAGRRGFDTRGSVVCQAPVRIIEQSRQQRRGRLRTSGGGRRAPRRRGFINWNRDTFRTLVHAEPEALRSRFRLSHGLLLQLLQREPDVAGARGGYGDLAALIACCHERARRKSRLLREAARLFRSLRHAGIVRVGRGKIEIDETLQRDFSLHHTLSLYLVDAIAALDPEEEGHALRVVSCIEAVLEDPKLLLAAQLRQLKSALMDELKAKRVPYHERMARLDELTPPRPEAEFLDAALRRFVERHPWLSEQDLRPKSLAREMLEGWFSFDDYVRKLGVARHEGVLLRYLGQVLTTLEQTVPATHKSAELLECQARLRELVRRTDTSLQRAWQNRLEAAPVADPTTAAAATAGVAAAPETRAELSTARELRARVRAELHALLHALSRLDFAAAARCLRDDPDKPWDAARIEAAFAPYFAQHKRVRFDPFARAAHHTRVHEQAPRLWRVEQSIVDEGDAGAWHIIGLVDLRAKLDLEGPVVQLLEVRD